MTDDAIRVEENVQETQAYLAEHQRIMELADARGIPLRIIGAISVILQCPECSHIHRQLVRKITDLDFISYGKFNPTMSGLFEDLGYEPELRHMAYYGKDRHIYNHPENGVIVDVFFDKLEMSHTIDFRGRLELDYPTITLTDLVLTKSQIVQINEKDLKDLCILFLEHELGSDDQKVINADYIARTLSRDWGFYYTFMNNLDKVGQIKHTFDAITEKDREIIQDRIGQLRQIIDAQPKSLAWKARARIGDRIKWYNDVEERIR